jgi:hypothetical protein
VIVGMIGPIGSGLPQFGFPRRFAMKNLRPRYVGIISTAWKTSLTLRFISA